MEPRHTWVSKVKERLICKDPRVTIIVIVVVVVVVIVIVVVVVVVGVNRFIPSLLGLGA